jgi:hypothetical protein
MLGQIGIAFLALHRSENDRYDDAKQDTAPAKDSDVNAGIAAVSVSDVTDGIGNNHEAKHHNSYDFQGINPPLPNAEIGKLVCFLPDCLQIEEPADQDTSINPAPATPMLLMKASTISNMFSPAPVINRTLIRKAGIMTIVVALIWVISTYLLYRK